MIAAIFSMENSVANSYKAGLYRMIGTLAGAFAGVLFVYIQPGNAILMGLGIVVLIFICHTFNWDRAIPIAGVMFSAIMLSLNNKNPIQYSFSRVLDTFTGIVIAVAVNYFIFPPHHQAQIRSRLNAVSDEVAKAAREFFCSGKAVDLNVLRAEIIDFIKFLDTYSMEFGPKANDNEFKKTVEKLEALRNLLSHLKMAIELTDRCSLNDENINKLSTLGFCSVNIPGTQSDNENIVYNYHSGKVLDMLLEVNTNQT